MPESDNSRPLEDDSGWKTTGHVEMVGRQTGFLLSPKSSVLSPFLSDLCFLSSVLCSLPSVLGSLSSVP